MKLTATALSIYTYQKDRADDPLFPAFHIIEWCKVFSQLQVQEKFSLYTPYWRMGT